jgi:hypothetical protein
VCSTICRSQWPFSKQGLVLPLLRVLSRPKSGTNTKGNQFFTYIRYKHDCRIGVTCDHPIIPGAAVKFFFIFQYTWCLNVSVGPSSQAGPIGDIDDLSVYSCRVFPTDCTSARGVARLRNSDLASLTGLLGNHNLLWTVHLVRGTVVRTHAMVR